MEDSYPRLAAALKPHPSALSMRISPSAALCGTFAVLLMVCRLDAAQNFAKPGLSEWSVRAYRADDGLPSTVVTAIVQDRDGYLWLGTSVGLLRFDGTKFLLWGTDTEPRLPSDWVSSLLVARDGSLWVGFRGGTGIVSKIVNGRPHNYSTRDGLRSGAYITDLVEDHTGTIWAGGRGVGLARFSQGRWEYLGRESGLPARLTVSTIFEDRQGILWLGSSGGLFRRRDQGGQFELASSKLVEHITEDASGTIWTTDVKHTFGTPTGPPGPPGQGRRILLDSHQNVWVGTDGQGLLHIPFQRLSGPRRLERFSGADGYPYEVVSALFEDAEGDVWAGTRGGLLRFYKPDVRYIKSAQGLPSNAIRGLEATSDGSVWVGTADGVTRFSTRDPHRAGTRYAVGPSAHALHGDRSGRLWIGTDDGLVSLRNGRLVPVPESVRRTRRVSVLRSDSRGNLWICRQDDQWLSRWDGTKLIELDTIPELHNRSCTDILVDSQGRVWVGFTDGSLAVYEGGKFHSYSTETDESILSIYEDGAHVIWVASRHRLGRFENGRFLTLPRDTLPLNGVTAIVEDNQGYLWLGVSDGLIRVSREELNKAARDHSYRVRYSSFTSSDGVIEPPTALGSRPAVRSIDGRVWFATANGVAVVDPRDLRMHRPAAARIERLGADDRLLAISSRDLKVPALTSRLEIQYTAVSLAAAPKARFQYLLEGFDRTWVDAGTGRQAIYTSLPPRDYRFRVRVTSDGRYQSEAVLDFAVMPAFYQTRLFYLFVTGLMTVLFWLAWRLRLEAVRRRFAIVLSERSRIGREIHDTMLQSMTGVALQLERLAKKLATAHHPLTEDLRQVRRQIERQMVEARNAIWDLRTPVLETRSLAEALNDFAVQLTANRPERFDMTVIGEPNGHHRQMEEELLRIGQEAIRNAVRHSEAQHVGVELQYDRDFIRLLVSDDGRGFDRERQADGHRTGWGLIGMQERANKIGAQLAIASSPGIGTKIETIVPLPMKAIELDK